MGSKNVFALGFHADYLCRHSGACCTADWDVPVELPVYRSLSDALVGGRLRVASAAGDTYPVLDSTFAAVTITVSGGGSSHSVVVEAETGHVH